MKKLNITKEQFEKSKYFKNKYGALEYVSESGNVFKTSKGKVLMFKEGFKDKIKGFGRTVGNFMGMFTKGTKVYVWHSGTGDWYDALDNNEPVWCGKIVERNASSGEYGIEISEVKSKDANQKLETGDSVDIYDVAGAYQMGTVSKVDGNMLYVARSVPSDNKDKDLMFVKESFYGIEGAKKDVDGTILYKGCIIEPSEFYANLGEMYDREHPEDQNRRGFEDWCWENTDLIESELEHLASYDDNYTGDPYYKESTKKSSRKFSESDTGWEVGEQEWHVGDRVDINVWQVQWELDDDELASLPETGWTVKDAVRDDDYDDCDGFAYTIVHPGIEEEFVVSASALFKPSKPVRKPKGRALKSGRKFNESDAVQDAYDKYSACRTEPKICQAIKINDDGTEQKTSIWMDHGTSIGGIVKAIKDGRLRKVLKFSESSKPKFVKESTGKFVEVSAIVKGRGKTIEEAIDNFDSEIGVMSSDQWDTWSDNFDGKDREYWIDEYNKWYEENEGDVDLTVINDRDNAQGYYGRVTISHTDEY